ncbi:DUF4105 domain-containing protein [Dyella silvatica]|uniref:lipoprotein N-acyltransferase Lnb domain-containing protein n=1 Tax=Dyella silvatica TaxID=2992128 RepID=UPI00225AACA2|nr:DUF4105 domain-containing protein [Dyella silvatica]
MSLTARALLLLTLVVGLLAPAHADIDNTPGANLEVALVSYGPGETYWERFGHDAIELRDTVSGQSVNFNYGEFNFDEKDFFINFARGRMHYLMGASLSSSDESYYIEVGRSVTRQKLALSAEQASALRDFLLWNLRTENATYDYDYYISNCSTKVRDALNQALGGALKKQLEAKPAGMTYRQQTARLMSAQPWLMLILDLGLGPYADQPLNAWQESFLPMVLQTELRAIQVADAHGGVQPLVQDEQIISANRLNTPPEHAPDLRMPLALAGLLLAALIVATWRYWPLGYALLSTTYLLLAGFVGIAALVLWTLTTHYSAWANANLLLFNPLAFGLLATAWRTRRGLPVSRLAQRLILLQLVATVIAVLLHALPGTVQQNQPWLLFALPCWLALAWTLRQPLRRPTTI